MIVCISANPAIDRRVRVNNLVPGAVNRAKSAESFAGGKAAHIAMSAKALGEEVVWIGFVGGATGDKLEQQMRDLGIIVVSIRTKAATRTNDEIIDGDGNITEILESGGPITEEEIGEFYTAVRKVIAEISGDFHVAISGSLPAGAPNEFYSEIIRMTREFGGKVIIDTSGEALMKALPGGPDLIKPNREEARRAVGFEIDNVTAAVQAARQLCNLGSKEVAISLGADGMFWSDGDKALIARPPAVEVISTVGCGDASVAGFIVGDRLSLTNEETIRLAVACGAANCTAKLPGQINSEDVRRLLPLVTVADVPTTAEISVTN